MSRRYVQLGYLVGALFVLFPLADLVTNIWPWNPGNLGWRYGSFGIASGFVLSGVAGLALVTATATAVQHNRTARTVAVLAWLTAIAILALDILYVLDALQIQGSVPAEARQQFTIGTVKTLLKNTLAALVLLWIGRIAWVQANAPRRRTGRSQETVLGSSTGSRDHDS